jgi:hypothetical protein
VIVPGELKRKKKMKQIERKEKRKMKRTRTNAKLGETTGNETVGRSNAMRYATINVVSDGCLPSRLGG